MVYPSLKPKTLKKYTERLLDTALTNWALL